jgi:hypothetical protein
MSTTNVHVEEAVEAWAERGSVRVHYNGGSFMGEIVLTDATVDDGWITGTRVGTLKEVWLNLANVTWIEEA